MKFFAARNMIFNAIVLLLTASALTVKAEDYTTCNISEQVSKPTKCWREGNLVKFEPNVACGSVLTAQVKIVDGDSQLITFLETGDNSVELNSSMEDDLKELADGAKRWELNWQFSLSFRIDGGSPGTKYCKNNDD